MWESGQTKGDNIKMILRENELGIDSSSLRSHFKKMIDLRISYETENFEYVLDHQFFNRQADY